MKVLLTGAKGMIGTALEKLMKFDSWDIKDGQDVKDILALDRSYDGIVHLAARSRVVDGYKSPMETWDVNTLGTICVLEKARLDGSWVINGSSLTAGHGNNVYSLSKKATEDLCAMFSANYHIPTISLQFSTVYGSLNDLPERFIPYVTKSLQSAISRLKLEDRRAWLSPTYVSDVAEIIVRLVDEEKNNWNGQVCPIISKEGFFTSEDLVNRMCALIGVYPDLIWGEKREWDPRNKIPIQNAILTDTSFNEGFSLYLRKLQKKR